MNTYKILNKQTGKTIYEGTFTSTKNCVEQAVKNNISLRDANLTYLNLAHANLDDAILDGADFTGSNLIGANLSEASLNNTNFTNCSLESTCLAFSSLENADFTNCRFGGTYIEDAIINSTTFSAQSCFHLEFITTASMQGCHYRDERGEKYRFSNPPVYLHGLSKPVVLIGSHIKIGSNLYPAAQALLLKDNFTHHHHHLIAALVYSAQDLRNHIKAA